MDSFLLISSLYVSTYIYVFYNSRSYQCRTGCIEREKGFLVRILAHICTFVISGMLEDSEGRCFWIQVDVSVLYEINTFFPWLIWLYFVLGIGVWMEFSFVFFFFLKFLRVCFLHCFQIHSQDLENKNGW